MPGMTTMPILPSAAPASNARSPNGVIAASGIADPQSATGTLSEAAPMNSAGATPATADPMSNAEGGTSPVSFADVLHQQLAQAAAGDATVVAPISFADSSLASGATADLAPAPSKPVASVESLLVDLSNLVARLSLDDNAPASAATYLAKDVEHTLPRNTATVTEIAPDDLVDLALDAANQIGALVTDAPAANADPGVRDQGQDAPPLDSLGLLAQLVQSAQPGHTLTTATETSNTGSEYGQDRKLITGDADSLRRLALAIPVTPTVIRDNAGTDTDTTQLQSQDNLRRTPGKSADFAAPAAIVAGATSTEGNHHEPVEVENNFEPLLAAAQSLVQHRNNGIHAQNPRSTPLPIETPVGKPGWDGEVADKLVWMVGRQEQRAELVLNPPQMGRIEVSLSMSDGQASAMFASATPAVRDALEAALPRLREILADAGINLGQAQVGADTANNPGNASTSNAENRDNSRRGSSNEEFAPTAELRRQIEAPRWLRQGNGLVDTFA